MAKYKDVLVRHLFHKERLVLSQDLQMPLAIEPQHNPSLDFLKTFLTEHSASILEDISCYGAVLLRGFDVQTEQDFEQAVLSIKGLQGMSDAFMSEEGRIPVEDLKYVLHTNAVYKTGGTLYLGGFHSENYYSTDVPSYICFACFKPSEIGGETGLVNMEQVYQNLSPNLQAKLEKNNFLVSKWRVDEVAERYQTAQEKIENLCEHFDLPVIGKGIYKTILMYKPNVIIHPVTQKKSLHINLFELPALNAELRKQFAADYSGKTWFWHRLIWKLPAVFFKVLEKIYLAIASFVYSPKNALKILANKIKTYRADKYLPNFDQSKVASCFDSQDIKELAKLIRQHYCSCLWRKGDILLVDNRKVMHAGMPGAGSRTIRALIANPITMTYSANQSGILPCHERSDTVGATLQNIR